MAGTLPRAAPLDPVALRDISVRTLDHYNQRAADFRAGTANHDVSQNINALLAALAAPKPWRILDFGCGPGRDLKVFTARMASGSLVLMLAWPCAAAAP